MASISLPPMKALPGEKSEVRYEMKLTVSKLAISESSFIMVYSAFLSLDFV